MAKKTVADWNMDEDIQLSNIRGYSVFKKFPQTLKKAYPDLIPFKMGFTTREKLPEWYAEQWAHLTVEELPKSDLDAFNTAISNKGGYTEVAPKDERVTRDLDSTVRLRYDITADHAGRIVYKDTYVMIQPEKFYLKRRQKMHDISESQFDGQVLRDEGRDEDSKAVYEADYKAKQVVVTGKKRGRPPKEK